MSIRAFIISDPFNLYHNKNLPGRKSKENCSVVLEHHLKNFPAWPYCVFNKQAKFIDKRPTWTRLDSMKGLLAIFFSFSLILSQAAFVPDAGNRGGPGDSAPKCCGHCTGCKGKCCIARNDSAPRDPAPAVPSHGVSQNDWQVLAAIKVQFLAQEPVRSLTISSQISANPSFSAPVYQRNCSYLI
jgi:hypothetical protein